MTNPIPIISLGGGVQSSTMALMAAAGELVPMPVGAIFADTQAEPQRVYDWLAWLQPRLPFPIWRVTQGSLAAETLKIRKRKDGSGFYSNSSIPAFTKSSTGKGGMLPRQCTGDFKLAPILRMVRSVLKEHGSQTASQWIGISVDEIYRMKPSRVAYAINRWPLVEARFSRQSCLRWMADRGFPEPPRSACVFCPYHSDAEWRRLREDDPAAFQQACDFERKFQAAKQTCGVKSMPFLHRSLVALELADLSTEEDRGQINLFNAECEGLCGV